MSICQWFILDLSAISCKTPANGTASQNGLGLVSSKTLAPQWQGGRPAQFSGPCHSVHCACVVHVVCHYVHCVFVVHVGCYYVHCAFSLHTGCQCACAIYIRCHFAHCVVHVGCHYVHCASFVHVRSHYVYSVCVIMSDATMPTVPLSFMLFPEIIHWKCWVVPQMINWTLNLIVKVYAEKAFRQINALKRISKFSNEQCQIISYLYTNLFTQTLNIV